MIISGEENDNLEMKFGVPQGTVLSTLLFNVYINGLTYEMDDGIFCFADDSAAIVCGDNWETTKKMLSYYCIRLRA